MNKISSFFYHLLNYGGFSFTDGVIFLWGDTFILFPPESFFILKTEIEKELGKYGKNVFYNLGYIAGKNASTVLIKKYGFSVKDFDKFTDGATQDGYGYIQIIEYPQNNKPVKIIVKGTNCSVAEIAKKNNYSKSFDDYLAGMIAGGSVPIFNKNIECIEEKCIAEKNSYCIFHVKETSKKEDFPLLKKLGINYAQLNKKILREYMNRKPKTNFLERKDVHFGDGTFRLKGTQGVLFLKDIFSILNYSLINSISDNNGLFENVTKPMTDNITIDINGNMKDVLSYAIKKTEVYGFGIFRIAAIKNGTLYLENDNNPDPVEYKKLFGISKKPTCNLAKAFIKNLAEKSLGKKAKVTEIECISQGKRKCIFKISLT